MDMVIICNISAWQYWATPPILREGSTLFGGLPSSDGSAVSQEGLPVRGNARAADRMIAYRAHSDLIGVSHPVHAMVGEHVNRRQTELVLAHRTASDIKSGELEELGAGLYILSIEAVLRSMAPKLSIPELALMIMEACGTYAIPTKNERYDLLLKTLIDQEVISNKEQQERPTHIREFLKANGSTASFYTREGTPIPWELCFDTNGRSQNLWKRPPLTSVSDLAEYAAQSSGKRGATALSRALSFCQDGSASPLESKLYLLLCLDRWRGGEGWPPPTLNQRIDFDEGAQLLTESTYAVADQLWKEQKICIEVNGKGFHADKDGFTIESGRTAALESMGYRVLNINHGQMADFDQLEIMLETFSKALNLPLVPRTTKFLKTKKALHCTLFGQAQDESRRSSNIKARQ